MSVNQKKKRMYNKRSFEVTHGNIAGGKKYKYAQYKLVIVAN